MRYVDRADAGRILAGHVAAALEDRAGAGTPLVLGIPRGGVVVAKPVAVRLAGELNIALARKIGAPLNPELAIGAVGENGDAVLVDEVIAGLGVTQVQVEELTRQAREELQARLAVYRKTTRVPEVEGRIVVVVDDGIATGATLRATLQTVRSQRPSLLVAAVPVGPRDTAKSLAEVADLFVCPMYPLWFRAVGEWYDTFGQVREAEVLAVLE